MLNAKSLNNTILAEHLIGSRVFPGLAHSESDYDWQTIIEEPEQVISGICTPLERKLRWLNEGNDNEYVSLFLPENYFKILHPRWQEIRDHSSDFLTTANKDSLRSRFQSVLKTTVSENQQYKLYANLLRRGWSLQTLLREDYYRFDFTAEELEILTSLRSKTYSLELAKSLIEDLKVSL